MKRIIMCLRAAAFTAALHSLAAPEGVVGATAIEDLDEAILNDIVQSYATYEPTTCNTEAQASATSFSFDWPGTNVQSKWAPEFTGYEQGVFQAIMSHTDPTGDRSWSIRIGSGGNMYSIFLHDLGEVIPPQNHAQSPWVDEVQQTVAVATALNMNTSLPQYCPGGTANMDNSDLCKKYFIHQAGAYQLDAPHTNTPFFSPSLAKHCYKNSCTFASWGTQAHVVTTFTSPIIYINRYTNCNDGIIEHTQMIHNFADPKDPLAAYAPSDPTFFDVGWGGIRPSTLPYALEPLTSANTLTFNNVNAVDNLPLCKWGNDHDRVNGPAGRAARMNLPSTGGYTTFVEGGLLVNKTLSPLLPPCRKPNVTCGTVWDANSCMVESCTQTQIDTQGYVRMALKVAPNSSPNCVADTASWNNGMVQLYCEFHDTGFGRITPLHTSYDKCAPWTDIGLFNSRTGHGLNIAYLRHWVMSPTNKKMNFVVYATDKVAAVTAVNTMFNNVGQTTALAIELRALSKNYASFTSPGTTIQAPTRSIPFASLPPGYDPSSLKAFTFVYGQGEDYISGGGVGEGVSRRRIGSTDNSAGRDYTVFNINWWNGARLKPSSTYSNRAYYFASNLGSVKATADSLRLNVTVDKIEVNEWSPGRGVGIYKRGATCVVQAASSPGGLSTTCASSSASLVCSGSSTPKADHVPYFYVKCQNSSYLGPNPYNFAPSFLPGRFPGHGSMVNEKFVRSYVCDGMTSTVRERTLSTDDDISDWRGDILEYVTGLADGDPVPYARPSWKLMGFFPIGDASCASLATDTYAESVCDPDPTSSPTPKPTSDPSSSPTHPRSSPTPKPTSCIALDQNYGRMPVGRGCPCGGSGCWGADTTGQCCSGYCRITDLGSSFCKATPTPSSHPTTSKPTMCISSSVNNGRMRPLVCECGVPGCISNLEPRCCSSKCQVNLYNVSFCKN